jgi:predicted alpha/beta hydrolase
MNGPRRSAPSAGPGRLPKLRDVTASGGARFVVRALRAPDPAAPVALLLPAMGTPARFYTPFARALHRAGHTVATADLRGQGEAVPLASRADRFGYRTLEQDVGTVIAAVRAGFPRGPLVLVGHSLGGQLALLHAALRRPDLLGIALIASGSAWWGCAGPLAGVRRLLVSQSYVAVATVLGHWPGDRLGFGGRQPVGVMQDWGREARTGRYVLTDAAVDYERALRTMSAPVLAVDVAGDTLTPPASVDHLCRKLVSAPVVRWRYTDEASGGTLNHFRWVRYHGGLVPRIASWIGELVKARLADA